MRVLWIGGSHPRHLYYINTIGKKFKLCGAVVEIREHLVPEPPEGLADIDRKNFIRHFDDRERAERLHFGEQDLPSCPTLRTRHDDLNSPSSAEFVRSLKPDLVLIFGSGMIRDPLFSAIPCPVVNLHLGLSPRYRGSATLFWPFYFMEPTYAGSTFHFIVAEPDAGEIIHQVTPVLQREDGIHDVACKTVVQSAREATDLLDSFQQNGHWQQRKQRATGKNFLSSDFRPQHLRVVYNVFSNDMVRSYLDGELPCKTPTLYRQF